jgi:hypothetical protein
MFEIKRTASYSCLNEAVLTGTHSPHRIIFRPTIASRAKMSAFRTIAGQNGLDVTAQMQRPPRTRRACNSIAQHRPAS